MGAPPWPRFEDASNEYVLDGQYLDELADALQTYSRMIVQYTLQYPLEKAPGHYVRELAAFTNQFTTQFLEHTRQEKEAAQHEEESVKEAEAKEEPTDESESEESEDDDTDHDNHNGEAQVHQAQDCNDRDMSSTTTFTQSVEDWADDVQCDVAPQHWTPTDDVGVKETPGDVAHSDMSGINLTIGIRWNDGRFPCENKKSRSILKEVQKAIRSSSNSLVMPVNLAAVWRSCGDGLEIRLYNSKDRETLIANSHSWVPLLPNGSKAIVIENTFPVVVRSVPHWVLTPSANLAHKKKAIECENGWPSDVNGIAYVGWLSGPPKHGNTGGLLVCVNFPGDANNIIEEGILLNGRRITKIERKDVATVSGVHFALGYIAQDIVSSAKIRMAVESVQIVEATMMLFHATVL
ncbi:hypothetical protein Plec18167_003950 [Paecilomyces lecythidis]|uniref:Uncharacterized protein n=1 Tax=Paecilomyces lecythidis TaxID=3004212 RepID=A0ABR3XVA4_9EURO